MTTPLKVLIAGLISASLAASVAAAGPPEQGAQPAACKPSVAVVLKGDLVSFGAGSFVIDVKKANKHGRALSGQQTVAVDDKTKFRPKRYDDFKDAVAGFRMNVQAKACKNAPAAALVARRVVLHPAKVAEDDEVAPPATP
jgi:hypothetical protein